MGTFPYKSLRSLLKTLEWPLPERFDPPTEEVFENKEWTDECQGMTNGGTSWFFAQDRRLWKFVGSEKHSQPIPDDLANLGYNHMGDLDYYESCMFL